MLSVGVWTNKESTNMWTDKKYKMYCSDAKEHNRIIDWVQKSFHSI